MSSSMVSLTDWFYGLDVVDRAAERRAATLERILSRKQRADAEDLGTLGQMIALGSAYIEEQDESADQANVPKMEAILATLAELANYEVAEPEAQEDESTEAASAGRRSAAPLIDRVILKPAARRAIVEELCSWDAGPEESRETGGYLIGRLTGRTLVVTGAFGPGLDAVRGYGRLLLDLDYTDSIERACLDSEVVVGNWHSHPGGAEPSSYDRKHWAHEANHFRGRSFTVPLFCGVIATKRGGDWGFPNFAAFLSRGNDYQAARIPLEEEERWQ